jgi:hypothetical protein
MSKYATPTVTPHLAARMETDRKPYQVRLEYRGRNKRTGGWSEKWWSLSGDGSGNVEVNHGKIGSSGRSSPFVFDVTKGFDTMMKKIKDGYEPATGSMDKIPPLDDTSAHRDLPGIYRDVRFIESPKPGVFVACTEDGSVVCRLTASGASKLTSISNLIASRTTREVIQAIERLA